MGNIRVLKITNLGYLKWEPILILHILSLFNMGVKEGFHKIWIQRFIMHIFKIEDKIISSNYRTIMIGHILAKLYWLILEKKISLWLEIHEKIPNGKVAFRRYPSIVDHFV